MLCGIVTTNEPKDIKKLLPELIQAPLGFDMKLFTKPGIIGIERKKIPGDLLSSIEDGRLGREILAMREECDICVVLLHGKFRFDKDGHLVTGNRTLHWTERGIRNLMRTIQYVEQCYIEHARTNQELVSIFEELQEYMNDGKHTSLKGRPPIDKTWIRPIHQEKVTYFYQGLPGIKNIRAKHIQAIFPNPIDLFGATIKDLAKVPGIGNIVAKDIYNFLRGIK